MPNCDFYATPSDHHELLTWLFRENTCHVYELGSEWEKPLRRFESADSIVQEFERPHHRAARHVMVYLQLYVLDAGPPFIPTRISLNPEVCDGARFRFAAEGWGLVQLYLASLDKNQLGNSHTNHSSPKAAEAWSPVRPEAGQPGNWDFKRITAFSSRLNREIRKQAVAKVATRAVLPGAASLWNEGIPLWPYKPGKHDRLFQITA